MPSYVITKNGARLHIRSNFLQNQTLCGRWVKAWWTVVPESYLKRRHCTHCLDRAARMSKREE